MKISEQWLREWVDPAVNTEQLAEQLTMLGHEVDSLTPAAGDLSAICVARVVAVSAHPEADRLTLCQLDYGGESALEIVCAANNVVEQGLYPFAPLGAILPDGRQITARKIKGITSSGMLCSAAELGLAEKSAGLLALPADAEVGQSLADYLRVDDCIIEMSLTPNRGDCLGLRGLARELAVLNKTALREVEINAVPAQIEARRQVIVAAPEACPRYLGRVINAVDVSRSSPIWLQERLRRCGIRRLNPIVDIGHYVMLELGQPMHAFDNDKLHGDIVVHHSRQAETMTLLNDENYQLPHAALLISDANGPVAMAGIMGGADSAVSAETKNIFLECAFFTPTAIAGRARGLGLQTDASHRYERGVDPGLQRQAVERATQLIVDICGGQPGPVLEAVDKRHLPPPVQIELAYSQINALLGKAIKIAEVDDIFTRLGLQIRAKNQEKLTVVIPAARFDLRIPADLIEEVARIHGFDNFPSQLPQVGLGMRQKSDSTQLLALRQLLVERGFQEVISYSFVDNTLQKQLFPEQEGVALLNAISSELAVMRVSLWPGLLNTLVYNVNRQQQRLRIFESGRVFEQGAALQQDQKLAGLIYGNLYSKQWGIKETSSDIFDLKGDLEALLEQYCGQVTVSYVKRQYAALHPGQSVAIVMDNQEVGRLGRLHPAIQKTLNIAKPVYLFEINLEKISPKSATKYVKISHFPSMRRDLSILVDATASIADIQRSIEKHTNELLTNLELFDVYQGEGIDSGKKSVTLGLTFQRSSSTLTDGEVEGMMQSIIGSLRNTFNARLRE